MKFSFALALITAYSLTFTTASSSHSFSSSNLALNRRREAKIPDRGSNRERGDFGYLRQLEKRCTSLLSHEVEFMLSFWDPNLKTFQTSIGSKRVSITSTLMSLETILGHQEGWDKNCKWRQPPGEDMTKMISISDVIDTLVRFSTQSEAWVSRLIIIVHR